MPNINKKRSKKQTKNLTHCYFLAYYIKTNPKSHILIERDSQNAPGEVFPAQPVFMTKSLYHISQIVSVGLDWEGTHSTCLRSVLPKAPGFFVCQGLSDSSVSDQLLRWYHGGSDAHAAEGTCWFARQSANEASWESPRLCRWEIMDGMFWLLSPETSLFCANGIECSFRVDRCRSCLVILPGGICS